MCKIINMKIKEARIYVFNFWWWLCVVVTALLLLTMTLVFKNYDVDTKFKVLLIFQIVEYVGLRAYKYCLIKIRKESVFFNELPCYLCNQATIMGIIACITKNTGIMSYCVTIGTFGSLLAYLMPDQYFIGQKFLSIPTYGFFGYHGLLIVSCLSFFTLGLYKPQLIDFYWGPLWMLILTFIDHIINVLLRKTNLCSTVNYSNTMEPENFILKKLYDKIPINFVYLLPLIPVFGVVSLAILSLLKIF